MKGNDHACIHEHGLWLHPLCHSFPIESPSSRWSPLGHAIAANRASTAAALFLVLVIAVVVVVIAANLPRHFRAVTRSATRNFYCTFYLVLFCLGVVVRLVVGGLSLTHRI